MDVLSKSVIAAAQKLAVHFPYNSKREKLRDIGRTLVGGAPDIVPQTAWCATRIAARRSMLRSLLRLNRGIKRYCRDRENVPSLTDTEWLQIRDIEGVMSIAAGFTTLMQTEGRSMRAMAVAAQSDLMKRLAAGKFNVIDLDNVTATDTEPRVEMDINQLTPVGKQAVQLARLEGERRWCNNSGVTIADITGVDVSFHWDDVAACLLDPRTFVWALHKFRREDLQGQQQKFRRFFIGRASTWDCRDDCEQDRRRQPGQACHLCTEHQTKQNA